VYRSLREPKEVVVVGLLEAVTEAEAEAEAETEAAVVVEVEAAVELEVELELVVAAAREVLPRGCQVLGLALEVGLDRRSAWAQR